VIFARELLRELVAIPSMSSQSNRPVVEWIQLRGVPGGSRREAFEERIGSSGC
jgi:hypothetical protein